MIPCANCEGSNAAVSNDEAALEALAEIAQLLAEVKRLGG